MKNTFYTLLCLIAFGISAQAQMDIIDARQEPLGTTVTVEGIATHGGELGIIRYLQDETAGIAAYPGTGSTGDFPSDVQRGDMISVTGVLKDYNGLLEIDPITAYEVLSSDNPLPSPLITDPNGINDDNEGQLIRIDNAVIENGGSTFTVGTHFFESAGIQGQFYVRSGHPLVGQQIPLATVNITGISSQFNAFYQMLPRDANDIEIASDFYVTAPLVQADITTDGFSVSWATNNASSTNVRYGLTDAFELGEINMGGNGTTHDYTFTGLDAAEFYFVQGFSIDGDGVEVSTDTKIMSTASNSTGAIEVYFNHSVDLSVSSGTDAIYLSPGDIEAKMIEFIDNAQSTIDACFYNNNRFPFVNALNDAVDRGVTVRYVTNAGSFNDALNNGSPDFTFLPGNGEDLMHNKFMIIDAESVNDSWVMSGSMNLTDNNVADDPNNLIFVQDQALAKAYHIEFEEMWGGSDDSPGIFTALFGADKADNTPHLFNIGGIMVECYFSPSDQTTSAIFNALQTTDTDLSFALLSFTKNELGTAVRDAHDAGADVKGLIENINDIGTEYDFLLSEGVDVRDHSDGSQLHHKYAIVDATNPASDPMVITGSHNWSTAAEERNDENTLIIHDPVIANIYLQEFAQRWCEEIGGDCFTIGINEIGFIPGLEIGLAPNPATNQAIVLLQTNEQFDLNIQLFNSNAQLISNAVLTDLSGNHQHTIDTKNLQAGMYFISISSGEHTSVQKMTVVK